jgi:hypothetical protein
LVDNPCCRAQSALHNSLCRPGVHPPRISVEIAARAVNRAS